VYKGKKLREVNMDKIIKVVIALGGNALEDKSLPSTAEAQLQVVNKTCEYLAEISCAGYEIAIVHGNGPQVGRLLLASETAKDVTPSMPFDVCGAMTQGYIGYHIQQGLKFALAKRNRILPVVTVVTQVVVNKDDDAFNNPTKPIGLFYTEQEAKIIAEEKGYIMREDSGRGWRRVVASPMPIDIVEKEIIHTMISSGMITISCGGGGIPVIYEEDRIEGIAAVIDKDFAAEKLAEVIDADILLILTAVDKICVNYNKFNQKEISNINIDKLNEYIEEGQFAPGSMLPKVEAAKKFVQFDKNKIAIIASLSKAMEALNETSGTRIVR